MNNNKNYDSAFCGNLPIHQVNMIQPYGVLVLVKYDLVIAQVSENCNIITGVAATEMLDSKLGEYLTADDLTTLQLLLSKDTVGKLPIVLHVLNNGKEQECFSLIHKKKDHFIIEIELPLYRRPDNTFSAVFHQVKHVMAEMIAGTTIQDVCIIAAKKLKQLSGYHRVLMYRFDDNWNGMVIAEEREEDQQPYLGLHFPASDVPRQARALYLKNPYRLIPDSDYTPVKLFPVINPLSFSFTDLSDCNLRSVVSVHLEYMKNMNVRSSMSVAIIHEKKLWGLISFHHKEPKYVSYEMCSVIEMISGSISEKISYIQNTEQFTGAARLKLLYQQLIEQIYVAPTLTNGVLKGDINICNLLNCTGAAYITNGKIQITGNVPGNDEIEFLTFWLQSKNIEGIFVTDKLPALYDQATEFAATGSGIIVLPLLPGEFLIGFRPEVLIEVDWGGNPNDAIQFEDNGKNYHPRNSFSIWRDQQRLTAKPWEQYELDAAVQLRDFLIGYSLKKAD